MSEKKSLSKEFMESVPYALRKVSKERQVAFLLMTLEKYPDQFEEFVENFGFDRYMRIMPKA